ncbi:putative amidohydrolase YhaA [Brevibacillus reuszeri]|uniref:M20 family metallopeptidase n=1 Tax=Brevibacillus reuszeri TaxID=54915 RepID=UPI001B1064BE|nr:M20 family metallopeptidase [Brevibacillus reuszeri]GIO04110.1 putative amidohydrolase YhaA [Brevibacillus reuszeri]
MKELLQQLHIAVEEVEAEMIAIRRDLHRHPELSFHEVRTPALIADFLEGLGLEVRRNVGGRGVVGTLKGGKPGKTIALRADFDALPIQDEKEVEYRSTVPGVMHACGHDGHTAALLGTAKVLTKYRDQLPGTVVFIHQFAEELAPGGARPMIEDGCLDGVDVIYGCHLQSTMPFGNVYYREGYIQAAADKFTIIVKGKGGHGAIPHETVDPIIIGAQIAMNLQTIASRKVDPLKQLVVSIGSFHAGDAFNVIPESAVLTGTVRTYDPEVRDMAEQSLIKIATTVAEANDALAEVNYARGYDALYNHPAETRIAKEALTTVDGANVVETPPVMPGEDFSYYTQKVPGSFFFTGAQMENPASVHPHHSAKFDFDERAMVVSAKGFCSIIVAYQQKHASEAEEGAVYSK